MSSNLAPLIGLTGRRKPAGEIGGFPASFSSVLADIYLSDYSDAVIAAGGVPVNIPFGVDVTQIVSRLDGLLLTGGTDIDPAAYAADAHPKVLSIEPERDDLELEAYLAARERELPVLGICRGLQVINVAHGGSLHQHVPSHSRYDLHHASTVHDVLMEPGTQLEALYGSRKSVNSLHHQTVDRVGDGLVVAAHAPDGEVEALELNEHTIAVQWHPELLASRDQDPVFSWLVNVSKS